MPKNEKTSNEVAKVASVVLKDKVLDKLQKRIDKIYSELYELRYEVTAFVDMAKAVAGSALTQAQDKKKV